MHEVDHFHHPHSTGKNPIMTTFLLVRHGQTELNLAERFRGRSEVPLNETGLAQAGEARIVSVSSRGHHACISSWIPACIGRDSF